MQEEIILQKEEKFHDEWAESIVIEDVKVDEFFEACTAPENRIIMKSMGDISGKKILELGCGAGEASVYMAKKGGDVVATDLSEGMLKVCLKLADIHNVKLQTKK